MIDEARTSGATVHFASLMDTCHLKNAELEAKHQKYKGRVVLRGDIVKDNSRISAGATEKLPRSEKKLSFSSWSYDMAGHAKKCVERYCE